MVSTSLIIYIGHFLSSWGDRMWYFAIPLFLLDLDPSSLFLTAAYGLTLSSSVLLFAPLVGDWIDRKPRLYAVTVCLAIQNLAVALSAAILIVNREFGDREASYAPAVQISAIILGAVGLLASTGTGIIIQKDWIVVVASGKTSFLANLNAMVRRIDLVTKILSPLACGQIMALTSLTGGAYFIVGWNLCSMVTEYMLLRIVYKRTPALARKNSGDTEELETLQNGKGGEEDGQNEEPKSSEKKNKKKDKKDEPVWRRMFGFIIIIKDGWKLYMAQTITKAGVGLACLFLTVLNFGYVSTSYAYNQCFSEFLVGILLGASAVAGIAGTYAFPLMRKYLGLVKTGVYSGIFQSLTLIPCMISLFVPGSPFFVYTGHYGVNAPTMYEALTTKLVMATTPAMNATNEVINMTEMTPLMDKVTYPVEDDNHGLSPRIFYKCLDGVVPPPSFLSLWLLLSGIIVARAGLWGFDLTVTQLIQENVAEKERGIVNGVQMSLSMSMDMIGYIMVLFMPLPSQFGILVIISSLAVILGHSLYAVFASKAGKKFDEGGALSELKKAKDSAPPPENNDVVEEVDAVA